MVEANSEKQTRKSVRLAQADAICRDPAYFYMQRTLRGCFVIIFDGFKQVDRQFSTAHTQPKLVQTRRGDKQSAVDSLKKKNERKEKLQ